MPRIIDLSHEISEQTLSFPGLPGPRISAIVDHQASRPRYDHQAEFHLGKVELACPTGTYLDSPFHRYRNGRDIAALSLTEVTALPGLVIGAQDRTGPVEWSDPTEDISGQAVLIRTGWDARWGDENYFGPGPFLGPGLVDRLISAGAALVGVDFANVDDMTDPARPAHTRLLKAGVLIVENLTGLAALPDSGFVFHAAPLKIRGASSLPVRAYALV